MGILDDKVTVITGASKGMGASHARKFVEEGAKVVIADIDIEAGEKLTQAIGENAFFVELDVTDPNSWNNAIQKAKDKFGAIDVLVNNAGLSGKPEGLLDLEEDLYRKIIDIDQHGVFYGMRAVVPTMIENNGGSIINISSTSGLRPDTTVNPGYAAAKHAVRALTKYAAYEFSDKNIRVNTVYPGVIRTPMAEESLSKEDIEGIEESVPMNRLGNPEEVSEVIVFLASDKSSFVSGADYVVDGAKTSINK